MFVLGLSHLCKVKIFTLHTEDTITESAQGFSVFRFPHSEGIKASICSSHHETMHLWLLSSQGVPQRDQITVQSASIRVHQVTEVTSPKWLLRPTSALWSLGLFMQRAHQDQASNPTPVLEKFGTPIRNDSLFPLHDNRHRTTPHMFTSIKNEYWP